MVFPHSPLAPTWFLAWLRWHLPRLGRSCSVTLGSSRLYSPIFSVVLRSALPCYSELDSAPSSEFCLLLLGFIRFHSLIFSCIRLMSPRSALLGFSRPYSALFGTTWFSSSLRLDLALFGTIRLLLGEVVHCLISFLFISVSINKIYAWMKTIIKCLY